MNYNLLYGYVFFKKGFRPTNTNKMHKGFGIQKVFLPGYMKHKRQDKLQRYSKGIFLPGNMKHNRQDKLQLTRCLH